MLSNWSISFPLSYTKFLKKRNNSYVPCVQDVTTSMNENIHTIELKIILIVTLPMMLVLILKFHFCTGQCDICTVQFDPTLLLFKMLLMKVKQQRLQEWRLVVQKRSLIVLEV